MNSKSRQVDNPGHLFEAGASHADRIRTRRQCDELDQQGDSLAGSIELMNDLDIDPAVRQRLGHGLQRLRAGIRALRASAATVRRNVPKA